MPPQLKSAWGGVPDRNDYDNGYFLTGMTQVCRRERPRVTFVDPFGHLPAFVAATRRYFLPLILIMLPSKTQCPPETTG